MVRIAGLPVWGPSDLIAAVRAVVGWTDDTVGIVAGLPDRVSALLDDVEALVGRISVVAGRVEALVGRADSIVGEIDGVLEGARSAVSRVDPVLTEADALVRRIDPLLAQVRVVTEGAGGLIEHAGDVAAGAALLVTRADGVAGSAAALVTAAGGVAERAGGVIEKATAVADGAHTVVGEAAEASRGARELLALYRPIALTVAPLAQRFVEDFTEAELQAAIRMIDQLPQLTHHLETDVMPILVTLDRVGPDVHELLDVLQDVRLAIQGVPGFKLFRRRGEREEAEVEAEEAAR